MKADKGISQRCEFRVAPSDFQVACTDCIYDVAAATFAALAGICDDDLEIWIFVQYLFNATVVPSLLAGWSLVGEVVVVVRVLGRCSLGWEGS